MKYLLILDSFKGSISSYKAAQAVKEGLGCGEIIPFSDGGEGFAECMQYICGGERVYFPTFDSYGREISSYYLRIGDTAVIETALADGLVTVGSDHPNIIYARSFGTGETIKKALCDGCKKLIIGFGGSAVNDGGAGALQALGARIMGEKGLAALAGEWCVGIDLKDLTPLLKEAEIIFACDVDNPYCGERGASMVFSPQKGADEQTAVRMEKSHRRFADILLRATGKDISATPGAGAAGGLAGGLMAVCEPVIKSGFEVLSDLCSLKEKINNADIIITGEGKTDKQTLMGKLPKQVTALAKSMGKRVVCVSGTITQEGKELGADLYLPLSHGEITAQMTIADPVPYLINAGKTIKNTYEV